LESYTEINNWRQEHIKKVSTNHYELNTLHDEVIRKTVEVAIKSVQREWGDPPASFAFFVMGSAGRFEQSVWSDQDHGLIFDGSTDCEAYFLTLGKEIENALQIVGYDRCEGKVMASNPLWCQSIVDWRQQITDWLTEASWESLRHFSLFFDSRVLIGEALFIEEIKKHACTIMRHHPKLYLRLVENVDFVKKGVGIFGQLLPESYGEQSGRIQLKQTTIFPYVNSLRLLALKENVTSSSTLSRFGEIRFKHPSVFSFEQFFIQLLHFRLRFQQDVKSYQQVHLLSLDKLSKEDKRELKLLMKKGYSLFSATKKIIENECSAWL
jgi:CBS domain-containing protein